MPPPERLTTYTKRPKETQEFANDRPQEIKNPEPILQKIEAVVNTFSDLVAWEFEVRKAPHTTDNWKLGTFNGRGVWFAERDRVFIDNDYLLRGIISAKQDWNHISNTTPNLELFKQACQALNATGVDLAKADFGHTINLSVFDPDERQKLDTALNTVLAQYAQSNKDKDIKWLSHGGFNQTGRRKLRLSNIRLIHSEKGARLELNPDKHHAIWPVDAAYLIEPVPYSEYKRLEEAAKRGQLKDPTQAKRLESYRTTHQGLRKIFQELIHRVVFGGKTQVNPNANLLTPKVQEQLDSHQRIFSDPIDTHLIQELLILLHHQLRATGVYIFFKEFIGQTPDETIRKLSSLPPTKAQQLLVEMSQLLDYYNQVELPNFQLEQNPEPKKTQTANRNSPPPQTHHNPEKTKASRQAGLPDHILPTSTLGAAHMLNMVGKKVFCTDPENQAKLPEEGLVIYQTTDWGNPVEAIMTAHAATRPNGSMRRALYITDQKAHSLDHYLRRVILPTVSCLYKLPAAEMARLLAATGSLPKADIRISDLCDALESRAVTEYLSKISQASGTPQGGTLSELYNNLNNRLCQLLGINHLPADIFLGQARLTVGNLLDEAEQVHRASVTEINAVKQKLLSLGLKPDQIEQLMKSLFGESDTWSSDSRKLVRTISGEKADITGLPPETLLSELPNQNLTLAGNGWVLATQIIAKALDESIIFAHKNTALGGNYIQPLLASDLVVAAISPVIRCVPGGGLGSTGDGIDIGTYFLVPDLVNQVKKAFKTDLPNVLGGKDKILVSLSMPRVWINGQQQPLTVITTSVVPYNGSRPIIQDSLAIKAPDTVQSHIHSEALTPIDAFITARFGPEAFSQQLEPAQHVQANEIQEDQRVVHPTESQIFFVKKLTTKEAVRDLLATAQNIWKYYSQLGQHGVPVIPYYELAIHEGALYEIRPDFKQPNILSLLMGRPWDNSTRRLAQALIDTNIKQITAIIEKTRNQKGDLPIGLNLGPKNWIPLTDESGQIDPTRIIMVNYWPPYAQEEITNEFRVYEGVIEDYAAVHPECEDMAIAAIVSHTKRS